MKKTVLILAFILFATASVTAETISSGWWVQTASTAGEGENVAMEVKVETPHIISLHSNNGWVGYAWYSPEDDCYNGFFELLMAVENDTKESWANEVFLFTLDYDGLTLTLEAKSSEREFKATFWMKEKL